MNNFKDTHHCKGLNRYKKETVTKQNKNKQQNQNKNADGQLLYRKDGFRKTRKLTNFR